MYQIWEALWSTVWQIYSLDDFVSSMVGDRKNSHWLQIELQKTKRVAETPLHKATETKCCGFNQKHTSFCVIHGRCVYCKACMVGDRNNTQRSDESHMVDDRSSCAARCWTAVYVCMSWRLLFQCSCSLENIAPRHPYRHIHVAFMCTVDSESIHYRSAADDVWFSGIGYVAFTWWCLIFWLFAMYVMMSSFFLAAGCVAVDVWFSGCSICTSWCPVFWLLDMLLLMSDFLTSRYEAQDVSFSRCWMCSRWCLFFRHWICSFTWWCLIFWLSDLLALDM